MRRIYLDNAATTPLLPAVANAVREGVDVFGNPSSIHQEGQKARAMVDEARRDVAALFNVRAEQIIFTSGGTEANALALKGAIAANCNFTLITQATEHDCVLNTAAYFSEQGTPVHFAAVDDNGVVRLEDLEELLKKHSPAIVSIMHTNNETGVQQPLTEIASICKKYGTLFHTDAVQAVGHSPLDFTALGADMLSFSGHKFGALKGIGGLVLRNEIKLHPLFNGGAQERNRRAGTENTLGIISLGAAARWVRENRELEYARLTALQQRLEKGLSGFANPPQIIGQQVPRAPHITQAVFTHKKGEHLVMALDIAGVAVSQGSACSSGRSKPSHVLQALGLGDKAQNGIRISLGQQTTQADIEALLPILARVVGA